MSSHPLLAALTTLSLLQSAWANPTISFPFNAQLPPVARPNHAFSYSFSPNTFRSDSNMTYSLGDHPSWLSLESESRRLYGTPKEEDIPSGEVVGQEFGLVATDDVGSTTMNATLVISRRLPPSVHIPISQQMGNFGHFSAPSSILSYPSTEFQYTFDPNTFGEGKNLNYYASSNDSTPLPAWIRFNDKTLTFSGRTPAFESLVQPPQTFDFSLVASDIVGFSGTSLSFAIVVGSHKLTIDDPIVILNATRGAKASYEGLAKGIQLDNEAIRPGSLDVSAEDMPSWLTLDPATLRLEGTPRENDHSTNFTIVIRDSLADALSVLVHVDVATGLFRSNLEDIQIEPGKAFNLDLSTYFRDPSDIELKVSTDPEVGWLHVDGPKLSGTVPKAAKGKFNMSIKAVSKSTGLTQTQKFRAEFVPPDEANGTVSSSDSRPTSPASAKPDDSHRHRLGTTDVLLATILPVLFITFAIMLLICVMRRRRRNRRTYISASKHRPKISDPIRFTSRNDESDAETIFHLENTVRSKASNARLVRKGDGIFAQEASHGSSRSKTSGTGTLRDSSVLRAPPRPLASGARSGTPRSVSPLTDDGDHGSWFTVERATTGEKSHKSSESNQSDTTLPEVAQPYLPISGFLSEGGESAFRSGLDLTLPSLDDLANIRPMPLAITKQSTQSDATTSSSAALPSSLGLIHEPFSPSLVSRALEPAKEPLIEKQDEVETAGKATGLKQPDQARLPGQQWFSRGGSSWVEAESAKGAKSFRTEPSFGSNENWRVAPGQRDPSVAYLELVDETPFLPSRTASRINLGQLEERRSLELMSPSKWGEDERKSTIRPMRSTSAISMLSDGDASVFGERDAVANGKTAAAASRREDSAAKLSERSFKMFI
ncbi:Axial budding pattern protein 2 [Trichoderma ghanense]|uniref:Axial budding pattern protein 2 n=1 Tax=Trichoderma ghanense TaxID=65468 RepID=A0ABY2HGR4_9HYPO